ncbi:hypothetical protein [Streptomyces sp. NPDC059994]|uniref:hypothetical protein n=1 Tax=Streptomyces sp. NPDC059994 TaxID=3347029 RepID=UPI003683AAAF
MATLGHDGLRAIELLRALQAMGPDTGTVARILVLTPGGDLVGAVRLADADVERLRLAAEEGAAMHAASAEAGDLAAEAEAFLRGDASGEA